MPSTTAVGVDCLEGLLRKVCTFLYPGTGGWKEDLVKTDH
jgi:hypothetical protein